MIDESIPISALQHWTYCPRKYALIHCDGIWEDNEHTERGQRGHARANHGNDRHERGKFVLRGLRLWSERYGLTGRADIVEVGPGITVTPVEYKIGHPYGQTAAIQLCAQALCLEEMTGNDVTEGAIWYSALRERHRIILSPELRFVTIKTIEAIRAAFLSPSLPPAVDDERCMQCQLRPHCLPDVLSHQDHVIEYLQELIPRCAT